MITSGGRLAFVLFCALGSPESDRNWVVVVEPVCRVEAVLSLEIVTPQLAATEWRLFTPVPPKLVGQSEILATVVPAAEPDLDLSARRRKLLCSVVAGGEKNRRGQQWEIRYRARLHARRLVARADAPSGAKKVRAAISSAERTACLRADGLYDLETEAFKSWRVKEGLVRGRKEPVVAFARRIFLRLRSLYRYRFHRDLDRRASVVCGRRETDCGGLSVLFVSLMRSSRIPARCLAGRWAKSADAPKATQGLPSQQEHVKAEFFVTGVGWVPVDLSSAILHDKTEGGLTYFGSDPGDFLVLHVDPDLDVDTVHFGVKHFHWLQFPTWWVVGQGSLKDHRETMSWKVKRLP